MTPEFEPTALQWAASAALLALIGVLCWWAARAVEYDED